MIYRDYIKRCDKIILSKILTITRGNESKAARQLAISRGTLRTKCIGIGID